MEAVFTYRYIILRKRPRYDKDVSFLSNAFGQALKLRRKELRLNQAKLAERMGTEAPTISRWENGEFLPTGEAIDRLTGALEITPEKFLESMGPDKGSDESVVEAIKRAAASFTASPSESSIPADILDALENAAPHELEAVRAVLGIHEILTRQKQGPQKQRSVK